ncbi:PHP domain-containing protein [Radiobacillus kanasensis]|uniref:PHP domain-containing protein n=1 Tax=Radiobacillus kanasensis TaxID=2844358 RepID=UPI001E321253|nr:PHP domain-containing protein [Radiobacillus kanasensis]UFU00116.1 PHP domain-containing protein [Radiobacillus kanasensis]
MKMDLHIHSTFSDGEWTPAEIIQNAADNELHLISITDHDEIAGYHEGVALAKIMGVTLIPGIELNTDGPDGEIHILGYQFDPDSTVLLNHIQKRQEQRIEWAKQIVEKLQDMQYSITFEDCMAHAQGGVIVRTHIAMELFAKGYFPSPQEAYNELLRKGAPAFCARPPFTAEQAIQLIHQAGGKAFLAHPGIYDFAIQMDNLVSYGLDGIEAYHSKHTTSQTTFWREKALELGLMFSGGSDHHGPNSRNPFPIGSVTMDEKQILQWIKKERIS